MVDPEIPVLVNRLRCYGTITDWDDPDSAAVAIELYSYGWPPRAELHHKRFPWLEVHDAWTGRSGPLHWY